jgi:threonine/homoserine/homoserine lactone efflux protein
MGEAIGQVLPLAVGVAISPMPIVAAVLMLVSARARSNGPAFIVGWLFGLALVGAICLLVADPAGASEDDGPATWVSWLKILVGALLVLFAVREWRGRPRGDEEPAAPKWIAAISAFNPIKAAGAGVFLSALNPKNLLLAVAAAAIAATGISGVGQEVAYAVLAVIGTIGVAAPVDIFFGLGDRAPRVLGSLRAWMEQNNAVIMAVLLLVIGAKLVGDGIAGL